MIITIDGIDCIGKSSLIKEMKRKTTVHNDDTIYLTEPSNNLIGKYIRKLLNVKDSMFFNLSGHELGYLFNADRIVQMRTSKLVSSKDVNVVIDRSFLSTIVYNSLNLEDYMTYTPTDILNVITPDICVILHTSDIDMLMNRLNSKEKDNMEDTLTKERIISHQNKFIETAMQLSIENDVILIDVTNKSIGEIYEEFVDSICTLNKKIISDIL